MKKILLKLFIFYRLYLIICFYHFKNNSLFLINDNENIIVVNIKIDSTSNSYGYSDVTKEWLDNADVTYQKTSLAKTIEKDGITYNVNKTNKIEFVNREKENAEWFLKKLGGKIKYLPTIQENGGVSCSDYKYYPKKDISILLIETWDDNIFLKRLAIMGIFIVQ